MGDASPTVIGLEGLVVLDRIYRIREFGKGWWGFSFSARREVRTICIQRGLSQPRRSRLACPHELVVSILLGKSENRRGMLSMD